MALSLKNQEVERLARELARKRGVPITRAVGDALADALLRESGRRSAPAILDVIVEISDRCAALPELDTRTPDEILGYDADGGFG